MFGRMRSPLVFFIMFILFQGGTLYKTPKRYTINLDSPAEQRWAEVAADYKGLVDTMQTVIDQLVPLEVLPLVEKVGKDIDSYLPQPYSSELKGLAKAINNSLGEVVLLNLVYDLTAHCTSIISQDANGTIWHARNLDYRFTDILRNITIEVAFTKGGKTMYTGTSFAGYVGLMTGQKPHGFTLSIDERFGGGEVWENALVALIDRKASMVSLILRQTLEDAVSFTDAVLRLVTTDTIAPVYYIVGGVYPGQGAIITRDRLTTLDTWYLDPKHGRWFIVETNYDHWKPPPTSDDRRDAANKMMNATGQNRIDSVHLLKVLSTPPVGRPKRTVYTTIMCARRPRVYRTWTWDVNTFGRQPEVYDRNVIQDGSGNKHSKLSGTTDTRLLWQKNLHNSPSVN